jgi:peptidoglycan/xylan/chitin deacetylase (PgdA/CDA1 family)
MTQSQRDNGTDIRNVLTFDVEDWFHGFGLSSAEQRHLPRRLQVGLLRILDILDTHQVRATFFILGSLADEYGPLLGLIVDAGHEIATHGYQHTPVYHISPADFAHDLHKALSAIHSIAGQPVKSYRAPFFSITNRNLWA